MSSQLGSAVCVRIVLRYVFFWMYMCYIILLCLHWRRCYIWLVASLCNCWTAVALNAHFFPKVLDSLRLRESSLLSFHQGMHRHRFHCRKRNGEVCNRSASVFLGVGASKISLALRKVVLAVQSAFGLLPSARRKYCEEAGASFSPGILQK